MGNLFLLEKHKKTDQYRTQEKDQTQAQPGSSFFRGFFFYIGSKPEDQSEAAPSDQPTVPNLCPCWCKFTTGIKEAILGAQGVTEDEAVAVLV